MKLITLQLTAEWLLTTPQHGRTERFYHFNGIDSQTLVPVLPELDFGSLSLEILLRDKLPSPETREFVKFLQDYR